MTIQSDNYLSNHLAQLGGRNRSTHRGQALHANYVDWLPTRRDARILEIGPGLGEFLHMAIGSLGYTNVQAVDTSFEVVEHCQSICPATAHVRDTVDFLTAHPCTFESIVLLHVLEHIPKTETIAFLQAIRNALRPDTGIAIIEVPNMANPLTGTLYRYADFTHEVGFTSSSMAQVLRMAGFEAIEVHRFATPRSTPARLLQWAVKWLAESAWSLALRLYQQEPELVSANVFAVARPCRLSPGPNS